MPLHGLAAFGWRPPEKPPAFTLAVFLCPLVCPLPGCCRGSPRGHF
ncbi:MAG: DUF2069 domain-containing protein [Burkholderia sp.]|nr:DUF2069 domain-containing protein [Escherichia coli]MCA3782369.1 DUF2069 domain-containing protein [Burkholderia sp.]MCA3791768.1 DUF2069 domain-containing protein [Burkholderia sp.]MCA3799768.1 DUF2069 domain-containing protein [Burkholderia sp.]MCA3809066.1 DUF2069 domain-containing protein [Burkholderia sp.]